MENLPEIIKLRGTGIPNLTAKLLKRKGNICLYERSDGYYELFIVQVSLAISAFGKSFPERETYPGNDEFGRSAWCYRDEKNALKEFDRLLRLKEKANNQ